VICSSPRLASASGLWPCGQPLFPLRFPLCKASGIQIGAKPASDGRITPIWLPIDGGVGVRRLFTASELQSLGWSHDAIRWGLRVGRWRRVEHGIYAEGSADPTRFDHARAALVATGGVASGTMAGAILRLDAVQYTRLDVTVPRSHGTRRAGIRRRELAPGHVIEVRGIRCTDGLQTLVDLAAELDDTAWEAALESALRRGLTSIGEVECAARGSVRGVTRMRRVLALRPADAPPTESLLETLMVQLARRVPGLPPPRRQVEVFTASGRFVARVDLAWPELGLFIELDGQHHQFQPVYDARRETAIVAATGWLCGRFTWREVVRVPAATTRRLADLVDQARRRPLPA
jgi:very-short-patch-repair endonuclease